MSSMIKGMTVTLIERHKTGLDPLNRPIYEETETEVQNVLVAPTTSNDVINATDLEGKKEVYTLAIPKGDTHNWTDARIRFWGMTFKAFGYPQRGMEENIPLDWNQKVTVERYG